MSLILGFGVIGLLLYGAHAVAGWWGVAAGVIGLMIWGGKGAKPITPSERKSAKIRPHTESKNPKRYAEVRRAGTYVPDLPNIPAAAPRPNWDGMRFELQKISYGMVGDGISASEKARFKADMTVFASADPLVKEITFQCRALVERNPGLVQSEIYEHLPDYTTEQVRYALYFAHELGWIFRKKKGRSYALYPPGNLIIDPGEKDV